MINIKKINSAAFFLQSTKYAYYSHNSFIANKRKALVEEEKMRIVERERESASKFFRDHLRMSLTDKRETVIQDFVSADRLVDKRCD